jgi:hypothetical protein
MSREETKPPVINDFSKTEERTIHQADGTVAAVTVMVHYAGEPEYVEIPGHEIDNYWRYPKTGETVVSGPPILKPVSQAEQYETAEKAKSNAQKTLMKARSERVQASKQAFAAKAKEINTGDSKDNGDTAPVGVETKEKKQ